MNGEAVLAPVATLLGTLAIVGGAVMWLAKLAAERVLAAHKEAAAKEAGAIREEVATLRAEVAELRGAAQPTIRAMDRLLHALEEGSAMTRLDTRQRAPLDPKEELIDTLRDALASARRWAGVPVEPDTGERAPMHQRMPA